MIKRDTFGYNPKKNFKYKDEKIKNSNPLKKV